MLLDSSRALEGNVVVGRACARAREVGLVGAHVRRGDVLVPALAVAAAAQKLDVVRDDVDGLAQRVAGEATVRWRVNGIAHAESVADSTAFVRRLFGEYGDRVSDLEVRRASLEDAYLTLVQQHEAGHGEAAARLFSEVTE
jgi:hypothetical protein